MNCCDDLGNCTQGPGCPVRKAQLQQDNSDGSDPGLPVVMFEKPWQWLQDLFYTVIYIGGFVLMGALLLAAMVWATGLHRVIFN